MSTPRSFAYFLSFWKSSFSAIFLIAFLANFYTFSGFFLFIMAFAAIFPILTSPSFFSPFFFLFGHLVTTAAEAMKLCPAFFLLRLWSFFNCFLAALISSSSESSALPSSLTFFSFLLFLFFFCLTSA